MSQHNNPTYNVSVLPSDEQAAAISLVSMATSEPGSIISLESSRQVITPPPIGSQQDVWSCDMYPSQEEVVMATNQIMLSSPRLSAMGMADLSGAVCMVNADSSEGLDSLHFDRSNSLKLRTHLASHDRRTSIEHVNDIIKRGAEALVSPPSARSPVTTEQRSPLSLLCKSPSKNVVKKVIVLQPGDDPEKITADAINEITEKLNMEAAARMAQGRIPEKETVIEITRITAPGDGYMIQDHLQNIQLDTSLPPNLQHSISVSPGDRKHHRRKSPHPKRYMYHSPSPPQGRVPVSTSSNEDCYFQRRPPHCSSHVTASSKLLGRGAAILQAASQINTTKAPQRPAILRPISRQSDSNNLAMHDSSILGQHEASILRGRESGNHTSISLDLSQHREVTPRSLSYNHRKFNTSEQSKLPLIVKTEPESECETTDGSKLNESLTNIQWLGAMSGDTGNLSKPKQTEHRDYRVLASEKQIDMISRECGRKKRPPYSYMHLIQMAICSDPNKRKTLREIYRWIEEKFPYYKFSQNQGWKNSIRHNLSLYDIFAREKPCRSQGKSGSSYWTLRSDVPLKPTKAIHSLLASSSRASSNAVHVAEVERPYSPPPPPPPPPVPQPIYFIGENTSPSTTPLITGHGNRKKGPVPLLPKPPPLQTYALIPIQGGMPVMPQQPIMVSPVPLAPAPVPNTSLHCPGSTLNTSGTIVNHTHHKTSLEDAQVTYDRRKLLAIRPGSATELIRRPSAPIDLVNRPGSATELIRHPSAPVDLVNRPGSATELIRRPSAPIDLVNRPGSATELIRRPSAPIDLVNRPGSATELIRHPSAPVDLVNRPGSATELIRRPSAPGSACELLQPSQHVETAYQLLAKEEVKPEGMSTPPLLPDANTDAQTKSNLKRNHCPAEITCGSQKKHVKIAAKVDIYDTKTHRVERQALRSGKATCTMTSTSLGGSNSPSTSIDSSELGHQLALIRFADSGIISDCSTSELMSENSRGLPLPKMYTTLKDRIDLSSLNSPFDSDKKKEALLSLDCSSVSELGLHDILSSIEKSLSTPMRNLLCTPPKSEEKNYFTSTPFKFSFGSPSWSPIKGLTPIAGDPSLEVNLFTPVKGEAMTSTPCHTDTPDCKTINKCTPEGKNRPSGHFHDLSPLKTPFKSPALRPGRTERSPTDGIIMDNHSFSKLLGEFHLESMIDEGINLDVSNMSFSALQ